MRTLALILSAVSAAVCGAAEICAPTPYHGIDNRWYTGIPSVAVSPKNGRMWATWYTGISNTEDEFNYCVLSTSADGGTTWKEVLVADPDGTGPYRTFDPEIWISPDGRLRWFYAKRLGSVFSDSKNDELRMVTLSAEDEPSAPFPQPTTVARGVMMCKPTAFRGEWLLPVAHWKEAPSACVYATKDGVAFREIGGATTANARDRDYDEHSIVEMPDGRLRMFIRANPGIRESFSSDGGRTWSETVPSKMKHCASRLFVARLASGSILMLRHGKLDERLPNRGHIRAYVSKDGGETWEGGRLVDDSHYTSYMDGQQLPDGRIVVVFDNERFTDRAVYLTSFREEDVMDAEAKPFPRRRVTKSCTGGTNLDPSQGRYLLDDGRCVNRVAWLASAKGAEGVTVKTLRGAAPTCEFSKAIWPFGLRMQAKDASAVVTVPAIADGLKRPETRGATRYDIRWRCWKLDGKVSLRLTSGATTRDVVLPVPQMREQMTYSLDVAEPLDDLQFVLEGTVDADVTCVDAVMPSAMPVLQPVVKEYKALEAKAFDLKTLPVFHQDQRQCEIAAGETTAGGARSVWDGRDASKPGVYIAVAGSSGADLLVREFGLDVPAKPQGYALKAADGRVAIVGHDGVGALYGAVTLAQMAAEGGRVEAAAVRDWPDVLYRGSISIGRGLYMLGNGEDEKGRLAALKAGFDMMLRNKYNMFSDHFIWVTPESDAKTKAFWREATHYAAERGIWANVYASTAVYQRANVPKDVTFDAWPCVKHHVPWNDAYYCWADDKLTEAAAERFAQFLVDIGAEMSVINIHPVDGGSWQDPEEWSRRCPKCRAKWNDHERWKASVNQFNIWTRVLRKRLPRAFIGSCIYPYQFNALLTPEKDRSAKWKESMPEYWKHLDESLEDKDFYFSSWITTPDVMRELRTLIPSRPVHLSDIYPNTAGIFSTYHRKIATCCEPGARTFMTTQGTDTYLHLESLLLSNEAMWDRNMPNAELFDGYTYYDAYHDHFGPKAVMDDNLWRICVTFWGRELAPYMQKVLSSGVMPEYLRDPADKVKFWNDFRRDPMYDPTRPDQEAMLKNVKYKPIADTVEMMKTQVDAAELCVKTLLEAEPHAASLDRFKRKYFMKYFKYAPFWLATARARWCARAANALVAEGRNAEALKLLEEGRAATVADYAFATKNFRDHARDFDTITGTNHPFDIPREWVFDEAKALALIDRTAEAAKVVLKPRRIGRTIRVGLLKGTSTPCVKPYLERFENVTVEEFDSVTLAQLDRFDCVFLPEKPYEKDVYFPSVKAYAEKGGGGVFLEGALCGNKRFDRKTPFPELVESAPEQVVNFKRQMKFADGKDGETMYVDFFAMKPGPRGEVRAYGPDGKKVLAVRGKAGLGKVFFSGTYNIGSLNDSYDVKECPLFGANAVFVREAIEYFTGIRLRERQVK